MPGSKFRDRKRIGDSLVCKLAFIVTFLSLCINTEFARSEQGQGESFVCLGTARLTDPVYPETSLTMAWNYDAKQEYWKAMQAYRTCSKQGRVPKKIRKKAEERQAWLIVQIMKQETDSLLGEWKKDSLIFDTAQAPENRVAVVPFVDLSEEQKIGYLALGIVDFLIRDLIRVRRLEMIERARMIELKKQMELSDSSFMDPATAPRVGAILRVDKVISGTLDQLTGEDLQINSVIYSRKAKAYYTVDWRRGRLHQVLRLQKELTFAILERLEIRPTRRERDQITELYTESMEAFMAYCLGLADMDGERYEAAFRHFEEALRLDPDFEPAKEMAKQARDLMEAGGDVEIFKRVCLSVLDEVEEGRLRSGRLRLSGKKGTGNFIPDDPNSPPEDRQKDGSSVAPVGTVTIRGRIR